MLDPKGQTTERWLSVEGFAGFYDVSDHGRVRSYGRWCRSRAGSRRWKEGRVLKTPASGEYPTVILVGDGLRQTKQVHRLVAAAFVPGWFDGAHVNHIDGNKENNHASNLEWVTSEGNMLHAYRHGLLHYRPEAEVRAMCADRARGMKLREMAEKYGCPMATICKIVRGERYRWIERPAPLAHYDHPGRQQYRCLSRSYDDCGTSVSFWIPVLRRISAPQSGM